MIFSGGTFRIQSNFNLNSGTTNIDSGGFLDFNAGSSNVTTAVVGAGSINKEGGGVVHFSGTADNHTGLLTVNGGVVNLAKSAGGGANDFGAAWRRTGAAWGGAAHPVRPIRSATAGSSS